MAATGAAVQTEQPWLQERKNFPLGGGMHTFKITVEMRGDGADYTEELTTVTEKAYNLRDALRQATERPLRDWFEDDIRQERDEDHEDAVAFVYAEYDRLKAAVDALRQEEQGDIRLGGVPHHLVD